MFGQAVKGEEIHVGRIERDILEVATEHHVARVAQGHHHAQFREHPQPQRQARGGGGILVNQHPARRVRAQFLAQGLEIVVAQHVDARAGKLVGFVKLRLQDFQERRRFVQRRHAGVGVEDLFQQGCPAAGMPAQKGQGRNGFAFAQWKILCPGIQDILRLAGGETPDAFRALVVAAHQQPGIRQGQHDFLGFLQLKHGLVEPLRAVQHLGQFVAGGIPHEGMAGIGRDEVAQSAFGLLPLAFAAVQDGGEITGLIVPRINGQAFVDRGAGLLQTMISFQQHRQADARVDAARIGGSGLEVAGAGFLRAAHGLVLMAHHAHQFRVSRLDFDGFAPRATGQLRVAGFGGGIAVFIPNHGRGRILPDQFLIEGQGPGGIAVKKKLPGSVEIVLRLGWHHAARHQHAGSRCGGRATVTRF